MDPQCYLVTYDISSPRRLRKVYETLQGFGEHVQLSVFRCDLVATRLVALRMALNAIIHHEQDQVLVIRLGPSGEKALARFEVLGRPRKFELPSSIVV
jgi:CRISPR-associated protein Cas2